VRFSSDEVWTPRRRVPINYLLGLYCQLSSGEALAAEERTQIVKASIALCNSGDCKPFVIAILCTRQGC
jgi:hypothetical protein